MLMIITGHTLSWGGILNASNPKIASMIHIIYAIILVEVNCFILLTGFFQSKSKFKIKKFINLLFITYSLLYILLCFLMLYIAYALNGIQVLDILVLVSFCYLF